MHEILAQNYGKDMWTLQSYHLHSYIPGPQVGRCLGQIHNCVSEKENQTIRSGHAG